MPTSVASSCSNSVRPGSRSGQNARATWAWASNPRASTSRQSAVSTPRPTEVGVVAVLDLVGERRRHEARVVPERGLGDRHGAGRDVVVAGQPLPQLADPQRQGQGPDQQDVLLADRVAVAVADLGEEAQGLFEAAVDRGRHERTVRERGERVDGLGGRPGQHGEEQHREQEAVHVTARCRGRAGPVVS
jgi:hypothetical protein